MGQIETVLSFSQKVQENMERLESDFCITAGDFNCVLDNELDKCGGRPEHAHKKSQRFLNIWLEEDDLVDIWRQMHPNIRRYTYHQMRPTKIFSRLDFFLIPLGLCGYVDKTDIKAGFCTDHSLITLCLSLQDNPRGPGFWKFNCSLLHDTEYVNMIKNTIRETVEMNREANHQLLWDVVKDQVRGDTIRYSSVKKKLSSQKQKELEEKVQRLESELDTNPESDSISAELIKGREDLDKIHEEKTKGARIRCRANWYEDGEKSTKYFLNLEKRNYNNKVINKLIDKDSNVITDVKQIQNEQKSFYEDLYSSRLRADNNEAHDLFFPDVRTTLTEDESADIEGEISESELLASLKSTANNKSPGSDGFPCEFYKFFWQDITTLVVNSLNMALRKGEMSSTQKHGLITLLPKKGKDILYLKNWRPITLLNVDYKLAAKCIAVRLKKYLHSLIKSDQTGFLKGRYIGQNISRILNILDITNEENIPAVMILIDFEKAFDSLEWTFITKTLKYFNFGESITNWVSALYKNSNCSVMNNGWASDRFSIKRGVRQGCPLSPYLFILAAEILSNCIRNKDEINGLEIDGTVHKISQYADDTSLFLPFDIRSIDAALDTFHTFQGVSGLKVNLDKTEIFPIGSLRNSQQNLYSKHGVKWSHSGVKVLGIHLSHNKQSMVHENFDPLKIKIENIIKIWSQRSLTLYGKVAIIKAFLQSQLVYQLSVLPAPPKEFFLAVEKMLFKFLWSKKPDKVKRNVLFGNRNDGGINMPNLTVQNKSLKAAWVHRIIQNSESSWATLAFKQLPPGDTAIFYGNISCKDILKQKLTRKDTFWGEVLLAWAELNYCENVQVSRADNQSIWYNSHIKVQNKVVFYKSWYNAGIKIISDLKDENGNLLSLEQFGDKFRVHVNFIQYYSIITAIPQEWKGARHCQNTRQEMSLTDKIIRDEKPSKLIYNTFMSRITQFPDHLIDKWREEMNDDSIDIDMLENAFQKLYAASISTRLRGFQFRLIHRIIGINEKLFRWGIKEHNLCDLCKKGVENYKHLFGECEKVKPFLRDVNNWIKSETDCHINFSDTEIILGTPSDVAPIFDMYHIIAKMHIYCCKYQNVVPNLQNFLSRVNNIKFTEKYIAIKNNSIPKFNQKWLITE